MAERGKKLLLDLLQQQGNNTCVDCGVKDPTWASFNIGIFICQECAGIHRSLGAHISKVRSVHLDNWDKEQLECMESQGNISAKERFEQYVPACYKRPTFTDPFVLREEWIKAKYERLEFQDPEKQEYLRGNKEGFLMKLGKDTTTKFNKRRFVLSETEGTLKYYNKEDLKADPKAVLRIDDTTVTLVPDKIRNPYGMQIMFDQDGHTRNIYVYADNSRDLINWFTCIRSAKLNRYRIAYPGTNDEELLTLLSRDFLREGWLLKKGPRQSDAYRRRWCSLDKRKLMYFEDPLDPYPKGEIFLGTKEKGFAITKGVPPGTKEPGYCFTLRTPDRHFHFAADSEEDCAEWMEIIQNVLQLPMSPQDKSSMFRNQNARN